MNLDSSEIVVIKIGSSLLADKDRNLRKSWIASIVEDIASLKSSGKKIIICSSGSVALGRKVISKNRQKLKIEEKQAAAAVGQPLLMAEWQKAFAKHKLKSAQILVTISDIENRRRYLNAKNTIDTLLEYDIIPSVNENDTVATNELRFGDNDRISALIAQMSGANCLVIFSDIDGLYTDDPRKNPDASHINEVEEIDDEIRSLGKKASSDVGSGGMITKITAAEIAKDSGCETIITIGSVMNPLSSLLKGDSKYTIFKSANNPANSRKNWIINSPLGEGIIIVDKGAESALKTRKSLLPVGVEEVVGVFKRGDVVIIKNSDHEEIARGISAYSNADVKKIMGKHSQDIEEILGYSGREALVHADDLVLC